MKKIFLFFIVFLASRVFAQADPSFLHFKNNHLNTNYKPLFALSAPSILVRTEYNFKLSSPIKKPVFCRMEDKLCNKFNVWLQLRAGSDQDYRKLAFPESSDGTKRSKLIE